MTTNCFNFCKKEPEKNELIVVHVVLQNSPNITGLFEVLTTLFATFFDVKSNMISSNKSQRSKIRERQKT
jgi:hypothetical protein